MMDELDRELARDAADELRRARECRAFEEMRRHNIRCTVAWCATLFFPVLALIGMALAGWVMVHGSFDVVFTEYGQIASWLTGLITIALGVYATGVGCRSW